MKKSLFFTGAIILTSNFAIAKTIGFDTPVKWNSDVIEQALNNSGFIGSSDAMWDVRVTHERILAELLKMNSFSVRDATRVCLDKCNMSDFLRNGRGQSGKKCPELCSGFGNTLVNSNNEYVQTGMSGTELNSNDAAALYSARVEKNGNCLPDVETFYSTVSIYQKADCRKKARKFAQQHACKLYSYQENTFNEGWETSMQQSCLINTREDRSSGNTFTKYNYTPTYKECVATFNEKKCKEISQRIEVYY